MPDISSYVLKPFPFSRNGIKGDRAMKGQTLDIPERLFDGLNREGYIRRAVIGDGHFTLASEPVTAAKTDTAVVAPEPEVVAEPVAEPVVAPVTEAATGAAEPIADTAGVVTAAPSPASATADLTEGELAALADGSWNEWRFFKQRSVAAKISDQPIKTGDDAKAAIEAFIAPKDIL